MSDLQKIVDSVKRTVRIQERARPLACSLSDARNGYVNVPDAWVDQLARDVAQTFANRVAADAEQNAVRWALEKLSAIASTTATQSITVELLASILGPGSVVEKLDRLARDFVRASTGREP